MLACIQTLGGLCGSLVGSHTAGCPMETPCLWVEAPQHRCWLWLERSSCWWSGKSGGTPYRSKEQRQGLRKISTLCNAFWWTNLQQAAAFEWTAISGACHVSIWKLILTSVIVSGCQFLYIGNLILSFIQNLNKNSTLSFKQIITQLFTWVFAL